MARPRSLNQVTWSCADHGRMYRIEAAWPGPDNETWCIAEYLRKDQLTPLLLQAALLQMTLHLVSKSKARQYRLQYSPLK